jgi:hypothetical protein
MRRSTSLPFRFRKIQIDNNQLWVKPNGRIDFFDKPDCLLALPYNNKPSGYVMLLESLFDKQRIRRMILHKQDGGWSRVTCVKLARLIPRRMR